MAPSFAPGSYTEGDWSEGGRMRFLTPDGNGMATVIAENRPKEFLSIKHVGVINRGVEDTESAEVKSWAPAYENYTLREVATGAELLVDMDTLPEYQASFEETWPRALEAVKRLAEGMREAGCLGPSLPGNLPALDAGTGAHAHTTWTPA